MITKQLTRTTHRATPLMPWLDYHSACKDDKKAAQKAGWATLGEAWNQCSNVGWLLWGLAQEGYSDDPILRLFACRCVRETPLISGGVVGDLLTDPRSWAAVEVAERFAQGQATTEELAMARQAAWTAVWSMIDSAPRTAAGKAAWAAASAAKGAAWEAIRASVWTLWAAGAAEEETAEEDARDATRAAAEEATAKFQAALLRQMIDPFRA